jgi:hypothetical protein
MYMLREGGLRGISSLALHTRLLLGERESARGVEPNDVFANFWCALEQTFPLSQVFRCFHYIFMLRRPVTLLSLSIR